MNRFIGEDVTLDHGGCTVGTDVQNSLYKGVDGIADWHARLLNWKVTPHPADPSKGPSRFAIRNQEMVNLTPDYVLAFFLKGAKNAGTQMTMDMALDKKLYVIKVIA